jgi:hypothetical protein
MGKYHCTVDLLFDWFEISCMTTDNFCFHLLNRLIQTRQTGGQWYSDTSPFSVPCIHLRASKPISWWQFKNNPAQTGKSHWRGILNTAYLHVLTSLDGSLDGSFLYLKKIFKKIIFSTKQATPSTKQATFSTKQVTLMRRSTALSLPP